MSDLAPLLLPWFERCGRKDLPWQQQQDGSGYRVWLSEIMLQQTQVATVIPYFGRFMEAFPDIQTLADAPLDRVLKHWAGLGYYARARNLHRCAQVVCRDHDGVFPADIDRLAALPGIGRSTAGAIASLAFGLRAPILDGNVKRVLSRLFRVEGWPGQAATQKALWALAEQHTPEQRVAQYNQAMMDLGATVCTRANPDCKACPLGLMCQSYSAGEQALYPHKKPRKTRPQKSTWMLLHHNQQQLLLERRPAQGIWGGLWSLPELDTLDRLADWQRDRAGFMIDAELEQRHLLKHAFSHYDLTISLAHIEVPPQTVQRSFQRVQDQQSLHWVAWSELDDYGLPAPVVKLLSDQIIIDRRSTPAV